MGFFAKLLGKGKVVQDFISRGAVIVDVRTPNEFNSGHIKGSMNIPLDTIEGKTSKLQKIDKPLILCCASGMRSSRATSILKSKGLECCNGGSWTSVNRHV